MIKNIVVRAMTLAAVIAVVAPPAASAQWAWTDKAELSFIFTGGNASSSTLGAKNTLAGEGGRVKFSFEAGAIRTESSLRTTIANSTAGGGFDVVETSVSETTAENYFGRGRFDVTVSGTAYWFSSAGWDRNTFSGVDSRVTFASGAGNQWADTEQTKFRTDLGGTYTIQNNVAAGPTDRFAGLRFTWALEQAVSANSTFESKLIADENLKNTDDLRADFQNSLSVSMSDRLALKTGLQLLFDNQPSFLDVPLFTGGVPTGGAVQSELRKLDSILTVALVINVT